MKKIMNICKFFSRMQFIGILALMVTAFMASSCKDDNDDPSNADPLVGTWVATSVNNQPEEIKSVKLTLKLNSDNTGSIAEVWDYDLKASIHEGYLMKFRWATTPDDNTLTIDYVSGDMSTKLFAGVPNTVHWTRKYEIKGNTLTLFAKSNASWTFYKK